MITTITGDYSGSIIYSADSQSYNAKPTGAEIGSIRNRLSGENAHRETSLQQLAQLIENGVTIQGAQLRSKQSSSENTDVRFLRQQLFAVDIDNVCKDKTTGQKVKLPSALETPQQILEISKGAGLTPCIIAESFSSTPELRKFHVLFAADKPVTDISQARQIILNLLDVFGVADEACKDPARILFGTTADKSVYVYNAVNTAEALLSARSADIMDWNDVIDDKPKATSANSSREEADPDVLLSMIDTNALDYNSSDSSFIRVSAAYKAAGGSRDVWLSWCDSFISDKKSAAAMRRENENTWKGLTGKGVTVGSLKYFAEKYAPDSYKSYISALQGRTTAKQDFSEPAPQSTSVPAVVQPKEQATEWEPIKPFERDTEYQPFPMNALPTLLRDYLKAVADFTAVKGEETTSENAYSPSWTFNYINGGINQPTYLNDAYDILEYQGAMKLADYPHSLYASSYNYSWSTNTTKLINALNYRGTKEVKQVNNSSNLSTIKSLISNGRVAVVWTNSSGWEQRYNSNHELFAVRGSDFNNGGHFMAVVGYDDNKEITVGSTTLKGALKLANSWGSNWGNEGYIWISYDALNSTSNYGTSWQSGMKGTRTNIFGSGNYFYFLNVKECDVNFACVTTFISNDPLELKFYGDCNTSATTQKWHSTFTTPIANPDFRVIAFDFFGVNQSFDINNYLSRSWTVKLAGNPNYTTYRIHPSIVDNLNKTIAPLDTVFGSIGSTGAYSRTMNINLAKGRVTSYDNNEITSADSLAITNYIIHARTFSNLQIHLADYNNDGKVNMGDVILMNKHIAEQNGETYQITDYIEEWGCSLADVIESEYDMDLNSFIAENYEMLSEIEAIPEMTLS